MIGDFFARAASRAATTVLEDVTLMAGWSLSDCAIIELTRAAYDSELLAAWLSTKAIGKEE